MAIDVATDLLACPVCRSGLGVADGSLCCLHGHRFDLARQGYANLLGGPEPATADTAAMLAARDRVHTAGLFEPVAARVAAQVAGRMAVLEVGSGTAYYLARALGDDPSAVGVALDVSKAAAKVASRRDPRIAAVVADVWQPLPVRDRCLDAVLCVFAPRNLPEFARVLRHDGALVVVTPRPAHLAGLRDRHGLLKVPSDKADQLATAASEFFELYDTRLMRRQVVVSDALAVDLIAMGPNAFHRVPEGVTGGAVTIDITVQSFRPLSS
ncbi:MAG TPA: methyltransferase domain-containing protein [Propionicimonas sp.]|nr:methyltransferase domain-containing protein [Propionicimonas sp.]